MVQDVAHRKISVFFNAALELELHNRGFRREDSGPLPWVTRGHRDPSCAIRGTTMTLTSTRHADA